MHHSGSHSPPPCSNHSSHSPRFRICAICSGPSNGFYFGVLSCRACASFFRRSALERRQYLCRRANNCAIQADGMRNSCRSCRLHRCIQAGMCMDGNLMESSKMGSSTPENMPNGSSDASPAASDPSKLHLKMSFDISTPNVHHFAQSLRNMHNGHKALVNVIGNRGLSFRDQNELRMITLEEHIQTHRGEITLLLAIIREHFTEFDMLPNETKVRILKCFALKLGFMNRAEMTVQTFPEQTKECIKIVLHPGCYLDKNHLDYFFSTVPKTANPEENMKHCSSILVKIGKMIMDKYRPLQISSMEFAALVGIQLWNSVERQLALSEELKAKRDLLFAELHAILTQRLGADPAAIGIRYGQLLGLNQDISAHTWEMEEVFTVMKIFNPMPFPDLWDDLLSGKQNLDHVEQTASMEKTMIALSKEEEAD